MNKSAEYLHNNCKLCAEHFEDCMFTNHEKQIESKSEANRVQYPKSSPKSWSETESYQ